MIKRRESNLLATNLPHSQRTNKKLKAHEKNLRKLVSALKVQLYKRMTKSAYSRPACTGIVQPCVSILDRSQCIFALLHATVGWVHRSVRYDSTCVFSTFFFSPWLPTSPHALKTHFYSGQFRRLLLTFLPRDRRTFYLACARTPRHQLCDTFFILYEFFHLARTPHIMHR